MMIYLASNVSYEHVKWNELAQDWVQWWALVAIRYHDKEFLGQKNNYQLLGNPIK
jgi:hypothetical protein